MMGLVSVLAGRMAEQVHRGATHGLRRHVWLKGALSALATLRRVGVLRVLWFGRKAASKPSCGRG